MFFQNTSWELVTTAEVGGRMGEISKGDKVVQISNYKVVTGMKYSIENIANNISLYVDS